MMKHEFEQRFGFEVSLETYTRIEALYMQSPEDKDTFVRRIKRKNIVVQIQEEIIAEMSARLAAIENYCTMKRVEYRAELDNERTKAATEQAIAKITKQEMYAYNQQRMALAAICEVHRIYELVQ